MPQIFGPQINWIARTLLIGVPAAICLGFVVAGAVDRGGFVTGEGDFVEQPVPFSHRHHVGELKIDCRYCHTQVEKGAVAGLPSSDQCMTCHSEIWRTAEMLKPVRDSARSGEPIAWRKVTFLPDFVYFNHSIHIKKGIGCVSCHGDMSTMNLTRLEHPMTMSFCLDCHRAPEKHLRPPEWIFSPKNPPESISRDEMVELEAKLARLYHPSSKTDCTTCHR